jgi:hypothetical protein
MVNVNTGYESGTNFGPQKGPTLSPMALFDPNSPLDCQFSDTLRITSGLAVFVQARNLLENRLVYVNSVVLANPKAVVTPDNVQASLYRASDVLYIQRMTLGDESDWALTSDNPQMIISLPGNYMFELSDLDILGADFRLDYYTWEIPFSIPVFPVHR